MSILIKGLNLPTPPDEHRLIIRHNGQVIISHRTDYEETEAAQLPKHGRLIDADIAEVIVCDESESGDFNDGILYAADWIANQPTVIEAEYAEGSEE